MAANIAPIVHDFDLEKKENSDYSHEKIIKFIESYLSEKIKYYGHSSSLSKKPFTSELTRDPIASSLIFKKKLMTAFAEKIRIEDSRVENWELVVGRGRGVNRSFELEGTFSESMKNAIDAEDPLPQKIKIRFSYYKPDLLSDLIINKYFYPLDEIPVICTISRNGWDANINSAALTAALLEENFYRDNKADDNPVLFEETTEGVSFIFKTSYLRTYSLFHQKMQILASFINSQELREQMLILFNLTSDYQYDSFDSGSHSNKKLYSVINVKRNFLSNSFYIMLAEKFIHLIKTGKPYRFLADLVQMIDIVYGLSPLQSSSYVALGMAYEFHLRGQCFINKLEAPEEAILNLFEERLPRERLKSNYIELSYPRCEEFFKYAMRAYGCSKSTIDANDIQSLVNRLYEDFNDSFNVETFNAGLAKDKHVETKYRMESSQKSETCQQPILYQIAVTNSSYSNSSTYQNSSDEKMAKEENMLNSSTKREPNSSTKWNSTFRQ